MRHCKWRPCSGQASSEDAVLKLIEHPRKLDGLCPGCRKEHWAWLESSYEPSSLSTNALLSGVVIFHAVHGYSLESNAVFACGADYQCIFFRGAYINFILRKGPANDYEFFAHSDLNSFHKLSYFLCMKQILNFQSAGNSMRRKRLTNTSRKKQFRTRVTEVSVFFRVEPVLLGLNFLHRVKPMHVRRGYFFTRMVLSHESCCENGIAESLKLSTQTTLLWGADGHRGVFLSQLTQSFFKGTAVSWILDYWNRLTLLWQQWRSIQYDIGEWDGKASTKELLCQSVNDELIVNAVSELGQVLLYIQTRYSTRWQFGWSLLAETY